jgi:hypothetical protein
MGTSIVCSCIMMWTYKRLNKEKEEHCAREGIQESNMDIYRDLADKSPLFRSVVLPLVRRGLGLVLNHGYCSYVI